MAEEQKEKLTLINKFVKVKDENRGIDNTGVIAFMYPNYLVKDEVFFDYNNDIIYTGKYERDIRDILSNATHSFIALCDGGITDVDFTNREVILQVLKDKYSGRFSKEKMDIMLNMSDDDFWKTFKKLWVKNSGMSKEESDIKIFDLYDDIVHKRSKSKILKDYFSLSKDYSDSAIFASMLSFIEKSFNPNSVRSDSGNYLRMLKTFKETRGAEAQAIIYHIYRSGCEDNDIDRKYRTMLLLTMLGKGDYLT